MACPRRNKFRSGMGSAKPSKNMHDERTMEFVQLHRARLGPGTRTLSFATPNLPTVFIRRARTFGPVMGISTSRAPHPRTDGGQAVRERLRVFRRVVLDANRRDAFQRALNAQTSIQELAELVRRIAIANPPGPILADGDAAGDAAVQDEECRQHREEEGLRPHRLHRASAMLLLALRRALAIADRAAGRRCHANFCEAA
mmetsp:Transcript_101553/g.284739  ORF Transcript_101553/g.284739 Transcript_101553/m.284739 type:complete len:200 (+) Transcript_101553:104-703(+)